MEVKDLFGNTLSVGDYVVFTNMGLRLGYDGFVLGHIAEIRDSTAVILDNEPSSYADLDFYSNLPIYEQYKTNRAPFQVIRVPDQEEARKRFHGEPSVYAHAYPVYGERCRACGRFIWCGSEDGPVIEGECRPCRALKIGHGYC